VVRADIGFVERAVSCFLEERALPYVEMAQLTKPLGKPPLFGGQS
jgi:hypothetical protein